jgi:predicted RNA binding protein YcfA (HicA-like mRNA interferase family)
MPRLPVVTSREMITALQRASFVVDHQTGSHVVLLRIRDNARVVVPLHNRDLGRGLMLAIIKSAGITREEFVDLLK